MEPLENFKHPLVRKQKEIHYNLLKDYFNTTK